MKKVISWGIALCILMSLSAACNSASSVQQKNVDTVLHLVLDAPNEELVSLLFREDALTKIGEGVEWADPYQNGYYNLLREKIGGFFTSEAYARFEQSDVSSMYHFVTYLTDQTVCIKKISYKEPDKKGRMDFTIEISYTLPTGEASEEAVDGFVVFENETISDFYLGGTVLHILNKTTWKPEDVPVFPMP